MDFFSDRFNAANIGCIYKKPEELEINHSYLINQFKIIETKFGKKLMVTLEDFGQLILPQRFSEIINEKDIKRMEAMNLAWVLIYKGIESCGNGRTRHSYSINSTTIS